ncbi:MAG: NAD(P)H-dependent oxidoreductase [Nevskia sp.]|nr:NAD(P)H-dependent oxidoreductase [Nevskia sp.]
MSGTVGILGICGSLRKGSYNSAALRAAAALAPPDTRMEFAELADFPLYNADDQARGIPAAVQRVGAQIRAADAVLFATPEYNYSVPGVLKNAIDWISRLPEQPFAGKPCAIMGASPGRLGTARAQYHLRQVGVYLDMRFLNRPEVMIAAANEHFDAQGQLVHAPTAELVGKLVAALRAAAVAARPA